MGTTPRVIGVPTDSSDVPEAAGQLITGSGEGITSLPTPGPTNGNSGTISIIAGATPRISTVTTWVVAVWLLLLSVATTVALLALWPVAEQVQQLARAATSTTPPAVTPAFPTINLGSVHFRMTPDVCIILLAMCCGVLGSLVHTLTRLTQSSSGKSGKLKTPRRRDALWFVISPIQGGLLAFFVIAAVGAGLLSAGQPGSPTTISLFTVAAIAGLTGLFSKRMTARLAAVINGVPPNTQNPLSAQTTVAPKTPQVEQGAVVGSAQNGPVAPDATKSLGRELPVDAAQVGNQNSNGQTGGR